MMQTTLFLAVQVLRGKSGVHILKVTQGDNKWNSTCGGKTLRERILKNISVCERHYSKDQSLKSMHKIITSLLLQKSLKVYCNSGIQPN